MDKNIHKQYERIVYRHLKCKRVMGTMQKLDEFVKRSLGKKYGFSIMAMLGFTTSQDSKQLENKNYFCSELVAGAYMAMGLLNDKICASKYLPVSFSGDNQLEWKNGAALGQEYLISL